jgi:hypothetical protein
MSTGLPDAEGLDPMRLVEQNEEIILNKRNEISTILGNISQDIDILDESSMADNFSSVFYNSEIKRNRQ